MSPYHHPNEQADYQAALESAEEAIERNITDNHPLFLEMIEEVFENEEQFAHLLETLRRIVNEESFYDPASDLHLWLRDKIRQFARRKAEQEVSNSYWRNR
jgi:glutathionylspermidine synthase